MVSSYISGGLVTFPGSLLNMRHWEGDKGCLSLQDIQIYLNFCGRSAVYSAKCFQNMLDHLHIDKHLNISNNFLMQA